MNNKNQTIIIILLTALTTTLIIGVIAFLLGNKDGECEVAKYLSQKENTIQTEVIEKPTEAQIEEESIENEKEEQRAWYTKGSHFVISEKTNIVCSQNGDPCPNVKIITEVDLTEDANPGDDLVGKFFVRAYEGSEANQIGEAQIMKTRNPFAGDGGGIPLEDNSEETLTIESPNPDKDFEEAFYIEKGVNDEFYKVYLNTKEKSGYNGVEIDFLYRDGKMTISFLQ